MNIPNDQHHELTGGSGYADLHIHSLFSDGVQHPRSIVRAAHEMGLVAFSITDHDSMEGIEAALDESQKLRIEFIPGIELTAMCKDREIHILGYFLNSGNKELSDMIFYFRQQRLIRYQRILEHLKHAGVRIKPEFLEQVSSQPSIGRLHIADALVKSGVTSTIHNAFRYYLGKGAVAYEEKCHVDPATMIRLISNAGGISVLAHPQLNMKESDLIAMIRAGLNGIETVHPNIDQQTASYYKRIVTQYSLLETGGSDSHGRMGFPAIGDYKISYRHVISMKEFLNSGRSAKQLSEPKGNLH